MDHRVVFCQNQLSGIIEEELKIKCAVVWDCVPVRYLPSRYTVQSVSYKDNVPFSKCCVFICSTDICSGLKNYAADVLYNTDMNLVQDVNFVAALCGDDMISLLTVYNFFTPVINEFLFSPWLFSTFS